MPANSKILPETMLAPETGLPLHRAIRPFEVRYMARASPSIYRAIIPMAKAMACWLARTCRPPMTPCTF